MSETELLQAMADAYFSASGPSDVAFGLEMAAMRAVLDVLHANGYRRCAEGRAVTQWCAEAERVRANLKALEDGHIAYADDVGDALGQRKDEPLLTCARRVVAEVERLRAQLARVEKMGWFCPDSAEYPNAKCDRAEKAEAERDALRLRIAALEDEKNAYIDYVGDALGQDHDGETLWDAAQRVLSDRDKIRVDRDELAEKLTEAWIERDALRAFKAYAHKRLDEAGVSVDPESPHKAAGCRIGGRLDEVFAELAAARAAKDGAYLERNQCVALIARMAIALGYWAGTAKTAIEGWSEDWHGCVYIDLPVGQVSWHYHDSQAHLFDWLPPYCGEWDGHDTPEKYERVLNRALMPNAYGVREQRRAEKAEAEVERLRKAVNAMHKFLDRDFSIVEFDILLRCESHDQAWNYLHEMRDIVRAARGES